MKKKIRLFLFTFLIVFGFLSLNNLSSVANTSDKVYFIQLEDDTINPVTAEYIVDAIDQSYSDGAQALVIKMDTPGGLLSSTRLIVKHMLTAKIPVIVYIAPGGSRAGSAGVFITYASHLAAMAPSTNIGAAHPVQMGQGKKNRSQDWQELRDLIETLKFSRDDKKDKSVKKSKKEDKEKANSTKETEIVPDEDPMGSKILNDTVAFIKSIAKERNRNIEWAIDSVVKSASITDEEALEKGVIEFIAKSDTDLLKQVHGQIVTINDQEITLDTADASIEYIHMDVRQQFFNILANPNIAYFLMLLGFYGLMYEITHPGFGVPGILGLMFLILAFYSMQTLPTNYAGLALVGLGIVLFISEAYIPGFGLLTLGGVICMALGSMLLFESVDPIMRVSKSLVISMSVLTGGLGFLLAKMLFHDRNLKVKGGKEGIVGALGKVRTEIAPGKEGKVFVHGEIWNAVSDTKIKKGSKIVVKSIDGLTLTVELNKN